MGKEADNCNCILTVIKNLALIIGSVIGAGPLLSLTIQQVCISKCLLMRRLPLVVGGNADDILLILLYSLYMIFNYTMISLFWSLTSKCIKSFIRKCDKVSKTCYVDRCAPTEPKKTKSCCVYGCSKAKPENSDEPDKTKSSTTQSIRI